MIVDNVKGVAEVNESMLNSCKSVNDCQHFTSNAASHKQPPRFAIEQNVNGSVRQRAQDRQIDNDRKVEMHNLIEQLIPIGH